MESAGIRTLIERHCERRMRQRSKDTEKFTPTTICFVKSVNHVQFKIDIE